jgi:hypothetical protein
MRRSWHITLTNGGMYTYGHDWDTSFTDVGVWFTRDGTRRFYPFYNVVCLSETKVH